jgi:hypothetical protein
LSKDGRLTRPASIHIFLPHGCPLTSLSEAERGAARTAQVSLSKLGNAALLDDALLCADFEQLLLNFPSADQPHASSSPVSESDQHATAGADAAPSNASGANWAAAAEKAAATAPGAAFKAGQAAGEHAQAEVAAKIAAKAAAKIGYAQRSVCVSVQLLQSVWMQESRQCTPNTSHLAHCVWVAFQTTLELSSP